MPVYIRENDLGEIVEWGDWAFPNSELVDFEIVVIGGRAYKPGEEPEPTQPSLEDQLAAIEAKYEQKQAELDKALVAALRMDGAQEASARASIKQKSLKLIQDQNDEIDSLFAAQQNGG